jgi:hypothetical protein
MTDYSEWIRQMRAQQKSTAGPRYSRPRDEEYNPDKGLLPFNRRRIIAIAIRDADFLERWLADPFTPAENHSLFLARMAKAAINRDRALALKARLPPEWTGPKQPTML